MRLKPARRIRGRASVPGDKSISHRAAIISSLAEGSSHLTNFATSDDCASTLSCLRQLGIQIEKDRTTISVRGAGDRGLQNPSGPLDCGNSGSTIRMLAGVLAGQRLTATLTGDESLRSRPMKRVIEPLELMGAKIQSLNGRPPLNFVGNGDLTSLDYTLPVASAQVKSALLLAGMYAQGRTTIQERRGATRDHTERMLNWFGVPVDTKFTREDFACVSIEGGVRPVARDVAIPGDISSAAFLVAAAGLMPGSELEIVDVGLNRTRTEYLVVLQNLGLDISFDQVSVRSNEPIGTITVRGMRPLSQKRHGGIAIDGAMIPKLIDELPLLAVVGSQVEGGITFRGAQELRLKESDRISSIVKNLWAMQVRVEEFPDGLSVSGPQILRGAKLKAFGDHRIAMAFSVAALLADSESELQDAECVSVSFPEFFETLDALVER